MIVRLLPHADLLGRDSEGLVLQNDGTLLRLSTLGWEIVDAARFDIEVDELVRWLEARLGAPPEESTADATQRVLDELAERGVLELIATTEEPAPPGVRQHRISDDAAFVLTSPERVVVLNLAVPGDQPRALLGTGASIWHALVGADENLRPWISEPELLTVLATAYATDQAEITPDVLSFLKELTAAGYLNARDG